MSEEAMPPMVLALGGPKAPYTLTLPLTQRQPNAQVEVLMSEETMAPMVLALGGPKAMRQLAKSNDDVKDFTKRVDVPKDKMPLWPSGSGREVRGGDLVCLHRRVEAAVAAAGGRA